MKKAIIKFSLICLTTITCICVADSKVMAELIRVAIIDSGATHFVDNAVSFTHFAADEDPLEHGTKIAELVRKTSPDAHITMLQVCENTIDGLKPSQSAVVEAIRWSVENDIDVVNMSLVINYNKDIQELIEKAAIEHNIVFVAASGNPHITSGFVADADGFIRKVKEKEIVRFPASSEHVISVGSSEKKGDSADIYEDPQTHKQKGTSFACARISGDVANVLSSNNTIRTPAAILSSLNSD